MTTLLEQLYLIGCHLFRLGDRSLNNGHLHYNHLPPSNKVVCLSVCLPPKALLCQLRVSFAFATDDSIVTTRKHTCTVHIVSVHIPAPCKLIIMLLFSNRRLFSSPRLYPMCTMKQGYFHSTPCEHMKQGYFNSTPCEHMKQGYFSMYKIHTFSQADRPAHSQCNPAAETRTFCQLTHTEANQIVHCGNM